MSDEQSPDPSGTPEKKEQQPEVRYVPVEYVHQEGAEENQINLLDLVKTVWDNRRTFLIILAFFTVLGVFNYLFGPTEYESSSVLIQEIQSPGGGQTQQLLQQLGGFNLSRGGAGEVIPPELYPQIVYSMGFQRELMIEEIEFENLDLQLTLFEYFTEHYDPPVTEKVYGAVNALTFRLPFTLYSGVRGAFGWAKGLFAEESVPDVQQDIQQDERFLLLSREERRVINELTKRITIEMEEGLITVRNFLPDPIAAAEINHMVVERIQQYVTDYRIEKARQILEFTLAQYEQAKERYDEAQRELASYRDQNVNLTTAVARTQLEDLQNQRDLRFEVYNSLSQQVEQSRLKLQEDTPVFNILQKSSLPVSARNRSVLLLIATIMLGGIFGVVWIFTRNVLVVIRRHIKD